MVTRRRRILVLSLTALVAIAIVAAVYFTRQDDSPPTLDTTVQQALDWLRSEQLAEGGYAGFSGEADPGMTADVALAFIAAGINPSEVSTGGGDDLLNYLKAAASATGGDAGVAAKLALAIRLSGDDPSSASGVNLLDTIDTALDSATGWYGVSFYGHALAVLALDNAGGEVPEQAVDALLVAQTPEGSWGFAGSADAGSGDSNTTSIVIQALVAVGEGGDAVQSGLEYLRSLQDEDGAIAYDASTLPDLVGDANSTALAIQAFHAAGEDPTALPGGNLVEALETFQNDSGAYQYQPSFPEDSLLATAQAIPALIGVALPYDELSIIDSLRAAGFVAPARVR